MRISSMAGSLRPSSCSMFCRTGHPASGENKADLLIDLGKIFGVARVANLATVLIVDEAHPCPRTSWRKVRLLSNLETDDDKLLQNRASGAART